jgi:hypothetical protein
VSKGACGVGEGRIGGEGRAGKRGAKTSVKECGEVCDQNFRSITQKECKANIFGTFY